MNSRHHWQVQCCPGLTLAVTMLVFFFPAVSSAQPLASPWPRPPIFETLSVKDGLSHSTVWAITQDAHGFLWFGTQDGLNRYDGYEFKVFRHNPSDPTSLSENEISSLLVDRQGDLWVGTLGSGLNYYDAAHERFRRFRHQADDPSSLNHDEVWSLVEDHRGFIWVATPKGVDRFDRITGRFERFQPRAPWSQSEEVGVRRLLEDRRGNLLMATGDGVARFNRADDTFQFYRHTAEEGMGPKRDEILSLVQDQQGKIWLGTPDGLSFLDLEREILVPFESALPPNIDFLHLLVDQRNALWFGGGFEGGVYRFHPSTGRLENFVHDGGDPDSLSSDAIGALWEDRNGVLWVGTYAGVDKYVPAKEQFVTYRERLGDPLSLSANGVWALAEDEGGDLWVGTYDSGLNRLDFRKNRAHVYGPNPSDPRSLPGSVVSALLQDRGGDLWVGTDEGISLYDRECDCFENSLIGPEAGSGLPAPVCVLYEDRSGTMWAGTYEGIGRFDRERRQYSPLQVESKVEISDFSFYTIAESADGTLWFGAVAGGLFRLDPGAAAAVLEVHDPQDPKSLRSNEIAAVFVDRDDRLWVGTYGFGLLRREASGDYVAYGTQDGLPNDSVEGILQDEEGFLWLSTNKGLSRFDPRTETFRNFDVADGLQSNVFSSGSAFRNPRTGEMFFGGVGGLNAFFPQQLENDPQVPQVVITDFALFNEMVRPQSQDPESPLETSILTRPEVVLTHRDYVFSFEFAALHFASPEKNRYAYRLEGFDRDWVQVGADQRFAQYSNLAAGEYVFRVRAANKDGVWNDEGTALSLRVLPPPWRTWWAYLFYAGVCIAAVLAYSRWQKREVEKERATNARLREVDRLKDEFLANTSHELRTPLYGIVGLAESLMDGATGDLPPKTSDNLAMIINSGRRLSGLVDDILDFSKLSRKSLELNKRSVDLHSLADVVLTLSRPLVGSKQLQLVNAINRELPAAEADENRLQQILHNLIGNAIKFTEEGKIEVSAVAEEGRLIVQVTDTGIGIDAKHQERIFDAFEQADASTEREYGGTGLGLAVTKQLVSLHGGSLWLDSQVGHGTTFSFTLPLAVEGVAGGEMVVDATGDHGQATGREAAEGEGAAGVRDSRSALKTRTNPAEAQLPTGMVSGSERRSADLARARSQPETAGGPQRKSHLLIVDDEPIIRQVLMNHLTHEPYYLTQAPSGAEALRLMDHETFDLVLLDVMMPKMSGYEVCRQIRRSRSLEELPILFLTAKNQASDIVTGLAEGANDYLAKPVTKSELLARVDTHLQLLAVHRIQKSEVQKKTEMVERRSEQVKVLSGLLPICGICKKIRDDEGYWEQIEAFIGAHSEAQFSHSLCPDCVQDHYPDFSEVSVKN